MSRCYSARVDEVDREANEAFERQDGVPSQHWSVSMREEKALANSTADAAKQVRCVGQPLRDAWDGFYNSEGAQKRTVTCTADLLRQIVCGPSDEFKWHLDAEFRTHAYVCKEVLGSAVAAAKGMEALLPASGAFHSWLDLDMGDVCKAFATFVRNGDSVITDIEASCSHKACLAQVERSVFRLQSRLDAYKRVPMEFNRKLVEVFESGMSAVCWWAGIVPSENGLRLPMAEGRRTIGISYALFVLNLAHEGGALLRAKTEDELRAFCSGDDRRICWPSARRICINKTSTRSSAGRARRTACCAPSRIAC